MRLLCRVISIGFLSVFSACQLEDDKQAPLLIFSAIYDFNESDQGWDYGFADYPASPADSTLYELQYAYTDTLVITKAVMLSGKNLNEDLFMFLKKQVTGLRPDTEYTITFSVELASNVKTVLDGSGKNVFLKAGATATEPKPLVESGNYVMNIDKGNQSTDGQDMTSLGEISIPQTSTGYAVITRNNTMANSRYVAKTNSDGELWLIIGTDSGLEGTTTLYYTKIKVVFSAS
jgi:hypothetical protein